MELLIFDNLKNDRGIKGFIEKNTAAYLRGVINFAETESVTQNSGREYIVSLIANDENILSSLAAQGKNTGSGLYNAALKDIEYIFEEIIPVFSGIEYTSSGNATGFCDEYLHSISSLAGIKEPSAFLDKLIEHYKKFGTGIKAKYTAFKYDGNGISGISDVDFADFDSLVGLEHQKKILINNTKAFTQGKKANNVLLFGDRGTGKSSSVKALLTMFRGDGLRIVELEKSQICNMRALIDELSLSPHKYIIFLDDLAFESGDPDYLALKVSMEGQLRAAPDNVLVYATSNRRHLIKETWADREGGEIHKNDQRQSTMSLSERFGISLVFTSPNQREYLTIVSELLKKHSIEMTPEIERQALIWEMNYSGFSGRCAKQFVSSVLHEK